MLIRQSNSFPQKIVLQFHKYFFFLKKMEGIKLISNCIKTNCIFVWTNLECWYLLCICLFLGLTSTGWNWLNCFNADEMSNSDKIIHLEEKNVEKNGKKGIRSHPLFFSITLGLLAEIINSRYMGCHWLVNIFSSCQYCTFRNID